MLRIAPPEYITLIQAFVNDEITAQQFDNLYTTLFLKDNQRFNQPLFLILDKLFSDVDCYSPDITEATEDHFHVTAQTLKYEAEKALSALKTLI
jgi:hypothetical protein